MQSLTRPQSYGDVMNMTDEDKQAIERFACAGGTGRDFTERRAAAVDAHRRYLHTKRHDWNLHMKFMSEVDTPCPDYGLRAMYRADLRKMAEDKS